MQSGTEISIVLPNEMVKSLCEKIEAGLYKSDSDIICIALNDWLERDRKSQKLNLALSEGLADVEAGLVYSIDAVQDNLNDFMKSKLH